MQPLLAKEGGNSRGRQNTTLVHLLPQRAHLNHPQKVILQVIHVKIHLHGDLWSRLMDPLLRVMDLPPNNTEPCHMNMGSAIMGR